MADNNNDIFADLVGKELDPETLGKILGNAKISFPDRPVDNPTYTSTSESKSDDCKNDISLTEKQIKRVDNLVDNVKHNEELVKTLEDMRDEMLKDMNIPPANKRIAKAAKLINGTNNITKETFDKAEAIIDIWEPLSKGYVSQLAPIIGDSRVTNDIKKCNDISKAAFDGLKFAKDEIDIDDIEDIYGGTVADDIAKVTDEFENKMDDMFLYILNKLFWNYIWTRLWVGIFDLLEKLIAKPIDTPIMILKGLFFRIPALTKANYYKFGPIHRALNKFRMIMLCKVPHKAWKDYEPEAGIKIFWYEFTPRDGEFRELAPLCADKTLNEECMDQGLNTEYNNPYEDDGYFKCDADVDDDGKQHGVKDKKKGEEDSPIQSAFAAFDKHAAPENEDACRAASDMAGNYDNLDNDQITPDCIKAAVTVLKAVYNDAKFNN